MSDLTDEELEERVLKYLSGVDKTKNKNVASAIGVEKRRVDQIINKLAKEDRVEYLYLGTSYVKLKGK